MEHPVNVPNLDGLTELQAVRDEITRTAARYFTIVPFAESGEPLPKSFEEWEALPAPWQTEVRQAYPDAWADWQNAVTLAAHLATLETDEARRAEILEGAPVKTRAEFNAIDSEAARVELLGQLTAAQKEVIFGATGLTEPEKPLGVL